jgi:hypothetical protein
LSHSVSQSNAPAKAKGVQHRLAASEADKVRG